MALRKWNRRSHAGGSTVTPSQVANSAIISTNQRFLPHKYVGLKGPEYGEGYHKSGSPLDPFVPKACVNRWARDRGCHVGSCGKARIAAESPKSAMAVLSIVYVAPNGSPNSRRCDVPCASCACGQCCCCKDWVQGSPLAHSRPD
jgi:hypothetical protein